MVTATRVGKQFTLYISRFAPIFFGLVVLLIFSIILKSYLESRGQEELEGANFLRNSYVSEYNSLSVTFNNSKEIVLNISISNPEDLSAEYLTSLDEFSTINRQMLAVAQRILDQSFIIQNNYTLNLDGDKSRVEIHKTYNLLITSLEDYYLFIIDYGNVTACFKTINLQGDDKDIRESIDRCSKGADVNLSKYLNEHIELRKHWELYTNYWRVVYEVHNSPSKSSVVSLQKKLDKAYQSVESNKTSFYRDLDYKYIGSYNRKIENLLLNE